MSLRYFRDDGLPSANLVRLLPAATVQKIINEILTPDAGMSYGRDARDLLIECCVEFITLISSEANEIAEREAKKTIGHEHVIKALEDLGFGHYISEVVQAVNEFKEQQKVRCSFSSSSCSFFQEEEP